jgi:hypothetical protein
MPSSPISSRGAVRVNSMIQVVFQVTPPSGEVAESQRMESGRVSENE